MENVFENAYFGKPYKTRDGRKAIYNYCIKGNLNEHYLIVDKNQALLGGYDDNGIINACGYKNPNLDIVSEWKEPINEEELDKLATNECPYCEFSYECGECTICDEDTLNDAYIDGFKAGYRKAKEV